jgi:type III secretion protein J
MAQVGGKWPRTGGHRGLRAMLMLGLLLAVGGCKADLYSRLAEREANLIIATLLRNGIAADRLEAKDGSSTVRVEQERFADAVTLLNAAGLPRAKFETMGDIFSSNGLVASPTDERARFIHALNQELARTVTEIDGVVSARVHVVLPKNDPLRQDQAPSAASVFIKYDARMEVTSLLPQIKTLIANSVEGLTYDKVAVVFVRSDAESASPATIDTTAALGTHEADAAGRGQLTIWLAAAAVVGIVCSVGFFWLWRRARETAALGAQRTRDGGSARSRDPLRVVS